MSAANAMTARSYLTNVSKWLPERLGKGQGSGRRSRWRAFFYTVD